MTFLRPWGLSFESLVGSASPARGLRLEIDGEPFEEWTKAELVRDVEDLAGSFTFEMRDATRSIAALAWASAGDPTRLRPGPEAKIFLDDELALVGWLENVRPEIDATSTTVTVSGRDKTGDLVDCAAAPDGPGEMRRVKLDRYAAKIAEPFKIPVRADVDVGEPFERAATDIGETALSGIERHARQRAILTLSDGVGGLLLTRSGKERSTGRLTLPGNMLRSSAEFSTKGRHSETIVKGQAEKADGHRGASAPLDARAEPKPVAGRQAGSGNTERERRGTAMEGRARDGEVKRHRPLVAQTRTKSTAKAIQDEAEWMKRTQRAQAETLEATVHGWRTEGGDLWRPNTLVPVADRFQGIFRDMLIKQVRFLFDAEGRTTEIQTSSPESYDLDEEGGRRTDRQERPG